MSPRPINNVATAAEISIGIWIPSITLKHANCMGESSLLLGLIYHIKNSFY